jgi:hypothetical protein
MCFCPVQAQLAVHPYWQFRLSMCRLAQAAADGQAGEAGDVLV